MRVKAHVREIHHRVRIQVEGWSANKFGGLWFSVNRRIYIHESTLFKLREIKDQNSLSSDDDVFRYLIMRHDYLCLVERIDYCSKS